MCNIYLELKRLKFALIYSRIRDIWLKMDIHMLPPFIAGNDILEEKKTTTVLFKDLILYRGKRKKRWLPSLRTITKKESMKHQSYISQRRFD